MKSKKELKEEYKHQKPSMGVFQIKNLLNGKILIDSSTDMVSKWNRHQTELKFGSHRNIDLQADWIEYGDKNFDFKILSELDSKENEPGANYNNELNLLKEMVIEKLNIKNELRY